MEVFFELLNGFTVIMQFEYLFWCLIGIILGTIVGVLPGLGPVTGIAILLPITFGMDVISALLLLMGIYQGAMYGGRISSILINVPGEAPSVVSAFDGYPLTKQGRAGYALTLSAFSSFVGGMLGFLGLAFLMEPITNLTFLFGAPEYFSLMVFALIATSGLIEKKPFKAVVSTILGLLIAFIGLNPVTGMERFTFGMVELWDGIDFVVVAVGVFGLSEVLLRIEQNVNVSEVKSKLPFYGVFQNVKEIFKDFSAMLRGSILGFFVGILPGAGATIATFMSYSLEKKISKTPEKFGKGASRGLSAPEAASNATIGGALIPLFSLGIPGSGTSAILLGSLLMLGLQPGPMLFEKSSDIIWPVIAGLILANIFLLILNTAFVPLFAKLITAAEPYLGPIITVLCVIGVYLINNSMFDVGVMIVFGVLGYILLKANFPLSPLLLAIVLGPMLESNFMQSLMMSKSDMTVFLTRPISALFLIMSGVILLLPFLRKFIDKRKNISKKNL